MAHGSQPALAALYDETSSLLNGILLRMLERPEDAEEVLFDLYMKAWNNAARYSIDRGSVQAWLITMARNLAIDRIRQNEARRKISGIEFEIGDLTARGASPEGQTHDNQQRQWLRTFLLVLPKEQRQMLFMAFFSGFTHSEISAYLGQPLGTVKTKIRTALLKLRTLIEQPSSASTHFSAASASSARNS
jgi:RNA polymerase sigma-70 factor (ECF subfamily)